MYKSLAYRLWYRKQQSFLLYILSILNSFWCKAKIELLFKQTAKHPAELTHSRKSITNATVSISAWRSLTLSTWSTLHRRNRFPWRWRWDCYRLYHCRCYIHIYEYMSLLILAYIHSKQQSTILQSANTVYTFTDMLWSLIKSQKALSTFIS